MNRRSLRSYAKKQKTYLSRINIKHSDYAAARRNAHKKASSNSRTTNESASHRSTPKKRKTPVRSTASGVDSQKDHSKRSLKKQKYKGNGNDHDKEHVSIDDSTTDSYSSSNSDDYQYWVKKHEKIRRKREASQTNEVRSGKASSKNRRHGKSSESSITEILILSSDSDTADAPSKKQRKSNYPPSNIDSDSDSTSDSDSDSNSDTEKKIEDDIRHSRGSSFRSTSNSSKYTDSMSDSESDFIKKLQKSKTTNSYRRSNSEKSDSDLDSDVESGMDSTSTSDSQNYVNAEIVQMYHSFVALKNNLPLQEQDPEDESSQEFFSRRIEKIKESIKQMSEDSKSFRKGFRERQDILPSLFSLLLITEMIGEIMKFYSGSSRKILEVGLDYLAEVSILARSNMIREGTRRGSLGKKDKYVLNDKDLNLDIGYSFGLSTLATQCENTYVDVQCVYFQSKTVKDTNQTISPDETLSRESKRVKRTILENNPISTESSLTFSSNFFKGYKCRHESCIMCGEVNDFDVQHCIGCNACFHIFGPCYDEWYQGPRMKISGLGKFFCPSCRAGQALVKASYENNLHMIYDLLVLQV